MVEWPVCQPQVEWRYVANESTSVGGSHVVVVNLVHGLYDELGNPTIPRGDIAIVIVTSPFPVKHVSMTVLRELLVLETGLAVEVWELPFRHSEGVKDVHIALQEPGGDQMVSINI
jgi:hypothetical protein